MSQEILEIAFLYNPIPHLKDPQYFILFIIHLIFHNILHYIAKKNSIQNYCLLFFSLKFLRIFIHQNHSLRNLQMNFNYSNHLNSYTLYLLLQQVHILVSF
jgi:hypothetical protein